MQQYASVVQDAAGNGIGGASVTVTRSAGGAATLYSGNGTGLLGSNVVTTDAGGNYAFYAANGRYTLTITASGFTTQTRDVVLDDPQDDGDLQVVSVFSHLNVFQRNDVASRAAALDVTTAVQAAIAAAGDNSELIWPKGAYRITATLTQTYNRQHWRGAGRSATLLYFSPTADDTCVEWGTPSALKVLGSMRDMGFYSDDSTFKKIAIDVIDTDVADFERISIQGGVIVGDTLMWSGANSVGIRNRGRDHITYASIYVAADAPFQFSKNPSASIDVDNIVMRDHYLIANGNPVVQVDTGINLTQLAWEGRHSWNKGTSGFRWIDTTSTIVSNGLVFNNIRYEQGTDATAYGFDIQHNTGLQGLTFQNCYANSDRRGVRMRKCEDVVFSRHYHVGANEALNVDATVKRMRGTGCFWQAGSTAVTTGQRLVYGAPRNPNTGALPPDFYYDESANTAKNVTADVAYAGVPFSLANNATLALGANIGGQLAVVTSEGFGAVFICHGSQNAVDLVAGTTSGAFYSNTLGTASKVNLGFTAGQYTIENRRGSTITVRIMVLGSYGAVS